MAKPGSLCRIFRVEDKIYSEIGGVALAGFSDQTEVLENFLES